MNWKIALLGAVALSFIFPAIAIAEEAGGTRVVAKTEALESTTTCRVRRGSRCFFAFDDSLAIAASLPNSKVFRVESAEAVACFTSDILLEADAGSSVKFWRVVSGDTGTVGTSFVPTAASTSTLSDSSGDCFTLVQGYWWIEVSALPGVDITSLVSITGIDKR
jgi:hypothetical protein